MPPSTISDKIPTSAVKLHEVPCAWMCLCRRLGPAPDASGSSPSPCSAGSLCVLVQLESVVMTFQDKCAQEQEQVDAVEARLRELGVDARKLAAAAPDDAGGRGGLAEGCHEPGGRGMLRHTSAMSY